MMNNIRLTSVPGISLCPQLDRPVLQCHYSTTASSIIKVGLDTVL